MKKHFNAAHILHPEQYVQSESPASDEAHTYVACTSISSIPNDIKTLWEAKLKRCHLSLTFKVFRDPQDHRFQTKMKS
jgi:hypothetical protein